MGGGGLMMGGGGLPKRALAHNIIIVWFQVRLGKNIHVQVFQRW